MSRGRKRKVVQLDSIKHQGKVLKMLGEIGIAWRPKTRSKNKLRLNMKKLLNRKLAENKITVIEDSSSQEKLEDSEDENKKVMKGKKQIVSENKLVFTKTKISEIFKEVRKKIILDQHQNDLKISCVEKGEVAEKLVQCSIKAKEYSEIPVTLTEHMEEDEEIFKKLKIPWMPEGMHPVSEGKCIDSENENL